jgi:hypothetical protein
MLIPPGRPPPEPPSPEPPSPEPPPDDEPESPAGILGMGLPAFVIGIHSAVAGLETEGAKAVLIVVAGLAMIGLSFFCSGWCWQESRLR